MGAADRLQQHYLDVACHVHGLVLVEQALDKEAAGTAQHDTFNPWFKDCAEERTLGALGMAQKVDAVRVKANGEISLITQLIY